MKSRKVSNITDNSYLLKWPHAFFRMKLSLHKHQEPYTKKNIAVRLLFVRFWLTAGNIGTIHSYEPGQKRKSADYNHIWNCTFGSYWHCLAMRVRLSKSVSKGILNQQICVKLQNWTWNISLHFCICWI